MNGKSYDIPLGGNYQAFLGNKDLVVKAKVALSETFTYCLNTMKQQLQMVQG